MIKPVDGNTRRLSRDVGKRGGSSLRKMHRYQIVHTGKKRPFWPIIELAGVTSFKAAAGVAPLPGASIDGSFFPSVMERNMRNQQPTASSVEMKATIDGMNDFFGIGL